MYFSVQEGPKTYWTHSSLIDEAKFQEIQKVHARLPYVVNTFTVVTGYGLLEAVNRINKLSHLNLYYRIAAVVVPTLAARFAAPTFFWRSGATKEVNKLLEGAPLWEKKFDVPELDKLYFFLDDDNGYEPNLWHHGL